MQVNYKRLSLFLVFACIILGSSLTYVVLSQGTNIPTITSGPYAGAPSYTVYKEGSTYYAKNSYGNNDYEGANATQVIDYALSSNKHVLIQDGTYDIQPLTPHSNNTIEGEGANTVLRIVDNGQTYKMAFQFVGAEIYSVTIKNLVIDGNNASLTYDGTREHYAGISLQNAHDCLIENVEIKSILTGATIAIWDVGSFNNIITKNHIHDCGSDGTPCDGMYIQGDATISNNVVEEARDVGILNFGQSKGSTISSNTVYKSKYYCIEVGSSGLNSIVANNVLDGDGTSLVGVNLQDYPDQHQNKVTITGNSIFNIQHQSIYIKYASNLVISNNLIDGNLVTQTGIQIDQTVSSATNITITANVIMKMTDRAIHLDYAKNIVISSNIIGQIIGTDGITLGYCNSAAITGNSLTDIERYGIQLYACNYTIVNANTVQYTGNSAYKIDGSGSACYYNIFTGNSEHNCDSGLSEVNGDYNIIVGNNFSDGIATVGANNIEEHNLGLT